MRLPSATWTAMAAMRSSQGFEARASSFTFSNAVTIAARWTRQILDQGGMAAVVNPFDYLTELQRHAEELKQNPSEWMPWNYRETLARLATRTAA